MRLGSSTRFRPRRFITNAVVLSFLVSAISGVALFLRPEGSLARWIGWSFVGLDKKQWEAVHLAGVAAFLAASVVHVAYNWRAALAALRQRTSASTFRTWTALPSIELFVATVLMGVLVAAGLAGWKPIASLVELRTAMKDASFTVTTAPPIADADRVTVTDLCRRSALDERLALENARQRGVRVEDAGMTLGAAAKANRQSPQAVYEALLGRSESLAAQP